MSTLDAGPDVAKKLRVAIIGCGQVAGGYDERTGPEIVNTHAKAYQRQPVTDLVAAVDLDGNKVRQFCNRWGIPADYSDVEKMLSTERPDIVSICTPDDTHAAMLEICLGSPSIRAVWCEKPLATDVSKAEVLVSSYAQRGVVLAVNYQRRWNEQLQQIKRALQQNKLGRIQKVLVFYTKGICHSGSHAVDLLLDWFGQPGEMQVLGSHLDFVADDPTVDAHLVFGDISVYLLGLDEREYTLFEIDILGTLGRVKVKSSGQTEWFRRQPDPDFDGYRKLSLYDSHCMSRDVQPMVLALQETVHAAFSGGTVRSNGESALATLRVCRQIAEQAIEK